MKAEGLHAGWWVWRIGANSRHGLAYRTDAPSDGQSMRTCQHRHRSEATALRCGLRIAAEMNSAAALGSGDRVMVAVVGEKP